MNRLFATLFYCTCVVALISGCAQVVAPTGGPKDTTPPKALSFSPENKSVHFTSNKISIKFNKYIQLKDLQNQLVISPPLKRFPKVLIKKGKILELELKDTLQDNTTYTFIFGNAIADINEGNVAPNFQYVVSTGSYLDSLKLTGQIMDAYTQNPQKDALVMLYASQNDSAPYKKFPSYLGHTDANGNYVIENIKAGSYKFIALSQSQSGYFYHPYDEAIAFKSKPVDIEKNDTVNALLFLEVPTKTFLLKARAAERGKIELVFNKPVDSIAIKLLNMPASADSYHLLEYSVTKDTVNYWFRASLDSLRFIVMRNGKNEDTAAIYSFPPKPFIKKGAKPTSLKLTSNIHDKQTDFDYHLPIVIRSDHPIAHYNLSHLSLTHRKDTIKYTVDSTGLPFIIKLHCLLTSDSTYRLFVAPHAFTDIFGLNNDTLLAEFKVLESTYFGSLKLNLQFAEKGTYIIQLIDGQNNTIKQDIVTGNKTIFYDALPPNTYRIRAIKDDNGDGKWTTGNYLKKLQPEKIFYYQQPVSVRSNWDVVQDWLVK